jgi:hypothetical protein
MLPLAVVPETDVNVKSAVARGTAAIEQLGQALKSA